MIKTSIMYPVRDQWFWITKWCNLIRPTRYLEADLRPVDLGGKCGHRESCPSCLSRMTNNKCVSQNYAKTCFLTYLEHIPLTRLQLACEKLPITCIGRYWLSIGCGIRVYTSIHLIINVSTSNIWLFLGIWGCWFQYQLGSSRQATC